MSSFKEVIKLLYRSLRRFLSLCLILGGMILAVRVYELFYISNISNYPAGSFLHILSGLKFDVVLLFRISAVLVIPFLFIAYFSQKAAKRFFVSISVLLILIYIILLQYFSAALVPLGSDLFGYTMDEIKFTIQTSGETRILPFVFAIGFLIYILRIFKKHVYFHFKPVVVGIFSFLMFASFLPVKILKPDPSKFENEFGFFVAENKLAFFSESVTKKFLLHETIHDQPFTFKTASVSSEGNPFEYIDPEYPFLHKETTPDVLGQYFNLGENPPNIVLMIVESLGRAYSGENAYLGSFTPFLDSLMNESLYWENCLSTSGRTFQVLPATLGSLPFGEHGFNELAEKMPDHLSLISILKKEAGYKSAFVYGSDAGFDNMSGFVNRQGIDQIIDEKEFSGNYKKIPVNENGFSWGYGDKELFNRYLEKIKLEANDSSSNLDVILTLAMHSPFIIADQDYYIQKFEVFQEGLALSEEQKVFNNNYPKQFSTVLYFDDALRSFIAEYKKLPSFENTIFIITGDHRMPEIPISTQIDRFHVPLVIYSPMLEKAEKFSAVTTHFDLAPSLLALLNGKEYISRPKAASWIGHGLDNTVDFRNLNSYPFMRNKNELMDFIGGNNFLANNTIYNLYPNLYIDPVNLPEIQQELKDELNNFIRKNKYVCDNNKLIPDSLKTWMAR